MGKKKYFGNKNKKPSPESVEPEESKGPRPQDNFLRIGEGEDDRFQMIEITEPKTPDCEKEEEKKVMAECDNSAESDKTYQMYALYNSKKDIKINIMAHRLGQDGQEFTEFAKRSITVGKQEFQVFHATYVKKPQFMADYQLQIKREGSVIGTSTTWDYYETYNHNRQLQEGEHQFIFNAKILQNNSHFYNKEPPGISILDPVDQLLYYSIFCIQTDQQELLQVLLKQFKNQWKQLPIIEEFLCKKFSTVYDLIISERNGQLDDCIKGILEVHGVLPLKITFIKGLQMITTSLILKSASSYLGGRYIKDEKLSLNVFCSELSTKGFLLHVLLDASTSHDNNWRQSLTELLDMVPQLNNVLIKLVLEMFTANQLKFDEASCLQLYLLINTAYENKLINLETHFQLLILLLELPQDLEIFLRILERVISPSVGKNENEDIEEEKHQEEEVGSEGQESQEEELDPSQKTQLIQVIDKYLKSFIKDIPSIVILIKQTSSFSRTVLSLFGRSLASKVIGQTFLQLKIIGIEGLESLRILFIEKYDPSLLEEVKFENVIKKLIIDERIPFPIVYSFLLRDWKDNIEHNKYYAQRAIELVIQIEKDPKKFIVKADEIVQNIFESNKKIKEEKNKVQATKLEEHICLVVVDELYKKNSSYLQNDFLQYVLDFTMCTNKTLQNQYLVKAQKFIITPNMKHCLQRILNILLSIQC